jgi:selenocysteine lyase/cysteine desulfurase
MTVSEILSNEELRRHEFPVACERVFLAHAGVCPLPRRVAEAIVRYATLATTNDQEASLLPDLTTSTRELAAKLLHVTPGEIAFVGPTSLGLSYIAAGLPWKPGDNVVAYLDDYPSNVYPWMALGERGVEVRWLRAPELGRLEPELVLGQIDARTRLVALASCHFISGRRLDYETIGRELRRRGVWFCLDAIQTAGAFPMDARAVDFLAADSHKWLLGPSAAGILYVRRELQEVLRPPVFGANNVRCPNFVAQETMVYRRESHRFEVGTHNLLGLVGLRAALELLLETGVESIAQELLRKRTWLVPALEGNGFTVLAANAGNGTAGAIVSFTRPGADLPALHQKLAAAKIVTSLRTDRHGQRCIRFSPHFYNTDDELQRALDLL